MRPTIGLALGGGAARGFAHIGVIRTLLAHGIVPDIIVGTSIGAVVGGCYAAGKLDDIEDWARGLTRRGMLGYLDISLSGSGLIGGGRLAEQLERGARRQPIEELPMRFAAIATEIRHRPRDLADARPPGRRDARLLCAAGNFPAGADRRPLAGRRRAGQSGAGVGRARARRAPRDRGQSQHRPVRPRHDHRESRRRRKRRAAVEPAQATACARMFSGERSLRRQFFGTARPARAFRP